MKKLNIALMITALSSLLCNCDTVCCDDGLGHCVPQRTTTCPFTGYNAWWY